MEGLDDRRRERVEVVRRQVGLAARLAGTGPEDRAAELRARIAQAHALAQAQEEAGDLGVAEHEVAPGLDSLVTLVHVLAARARGA